MGALRDDGAGPARGDTLGAQDSGLGIGRDKEYIDVAEGRLFDPKGAKGRYVRLYSRGNTANDMNHYVEVEVFGKPAK